MNLARFVAIPLHRQTKDKTKQMAEYKLKTGKVAKAVTKGYKAIEEGVVGGYKAIENGVVGGYKAIEDGVVSGYKRIEKSFVERFLERVEENEDGSKKESEEK